MDDKNKKSILQDMDTVAIQMGLLQNPEDYLIDNGAPPSVLQAFLDRQFNTLVKATAKATGASEEQIADKEKRTPEQDRVMLEISGRRSLARIHMYLDSDYILAHNKLREAAKEKGYIDNEITINKETGISELEQAINYIVRFFFAMHRGIDPRESGKLNEIYFLELYALLDKVLAIKTDKPSTPYLEAVKKVIGIDIQENPAAKEKTESIAAKKAEAIQYPLDKVNSTIWALFEHDTKGQIGIAVEKSGSKNELSILYAINFDELEDSVRITKRLDAFDKRAYIAASALYNAGNTKFTISQIWGAMGNASKPNAVQIERVNNSVTKMAGAHIFIDNIEESRVYKYKNFRYDASLLPIERCTCTVNGQLTEGVIHLFREPPLMTFAKERNQITSFTSKLLQSPCSKTNTNLQIEDYLIERIAHAKTGKQSRRILFKTIYEKAGITTPTQRSRAPEKIKAYLDHYIKCGYIKSYKMAGDGVSISFESTESD